MRLVSPEKIREIDEYAIKKLNIPAVELMGRSAEAIAKCVRENYSDAKNILILAGSGNNGGDGYAAALRLCSEYAVHIVDVFGMGQRTDEGKYYLEKCKEQMIPISVYSNLTEMTALFSDADVIIDAILGAGAKLPLKEPLTEICSLISKSAAKKIAVDIPLGVNAENGEVTEAPVRFDITVSLSLAKVGIMSYPAREYAGRIINDGIGLGEDSDWLLDIATEEYILTDSDEASRLLPKRAENSNKGSFGKLSVIAGSAEYGGAPLLALGGALRSGVGYVTFFGEESSRSQVLCKYPEVIFKERPSFENMTDADIEKILSETQNSSAVLIGSGCGRSAGLLSLVYAFLASSGAPLVLDADAINMLGSDRENALRAINESPRVLIFTPHPLEFARLFGKEISEVQNRRLTLAKEFSLNTGGAILTLKGAATIVTNGKRTYINSSGSSALAKAGSGDVLAGIVASLIASSSGAELDLCALGVYAHGRAGDMLSGIYSTLGVTPSDLPEAAAVALAELEQNKAP